MKATQIHISWSKRVYTTAKTSQINYWNNCSYFSFIFVFFYRVVSIMPKNTSKRSASLPSGQNRLKSRFLLFTVVGDLASHVYTLQSIEMWERASEQALPTKLRITFCLVQCNFIDRQTLNELNCIKMISAAAVSHF